MKHTYTLLVFCFLLYSSCTQKRIKKYEALLDPMVGVSKKIELSKKLGSPTFCKSAGDDELCEYRTVKSHNENIPAVLQKAEGFPDLSPYDYFDVLHLTFDPFGNFKEWEAVVLSP